VNTALDERYGRGGAARRRRLVLGAIALGAAILAPIVWVVWVGLLGPAASLESRDVAHVILDDESVDVRFDVSTSPGTTVSCAIQALNESFAIVGWKIVHLPAATERTRQFIDNVKTSETPVTGLIYRCWLT